LLGYLKVGLPAAMLAALVGCARDYSPNTYSSAAVQQANKVVQGVVVGVRPVAISADGTVGAVSGGAAGGVLGAQVPGTGVNTALGAVGGTMLGGLLGSAAEHAAGDTAGFEYIVRESDGELLSVTQKDATPLAIGQKVLLISGNQARVVPDYSVTLDPPPAPAPAAAKEEPPAKAPPSEAAASGHDGPAPAPNPVAAETAPVPSSELPEAVATEPSPPSSNAESRPGEDIPVAASSPETRRAPAALETTPTE
jgi:outer membrane lipoprotein SlyB